MRYVLLLIALLASPAFADALPEVYASAPSAVAVTVYRDDLALVTETRTVQLPTNAARIVFEGVLDRIVPESVILQGLGNGGERNFDYDALTPRALLWRALGEEVNVTRGPVGTRARAAAAVSERATITAAGNGLLLTYADRTEALGCSGLPEHISFDRIPVGMRQQPTLSANIPNAAPGEHSITLSYLVTGMSWDADYTLTLSEDATHADLSAWLTLDNDGTQGIEAANLSVIAGDLSRVMDEPLRMALTKAAQRACWPMATTSNLRHRGRRVGYAMDAVSVAAPPPPPPMMARMSAVEEVVVTASHVAERETLQDYQLYRVPFPTDVLAAQSKQVMLLQPTRIAIERLYSHREAAIPESHANPLRSVKILLRSRNDDAHGLGIPLPGGDVRLYAPHGSDAALLTQIAEADDTPTDVDWRVELGESPAVTVQTELLGQRTRAHWFANGITVRRSLEHVLTNATNSAQLFEFVQTAQDNDNGNRVTTPEIDDASDPFTMKDGLPTWRLTLAANSTHVLRYEATFEVFADND